MGTKRAILRASAEIFASKGFDGATIREICQRADCNIAAINYHFGSKDFLYRQVCEMLFSMPDAFSLLQNPGKGRRLSGDWREFLALLVREFLEGAINGSTLFRCRFQIMFREMLAPSPFFPEIFEVHLRPRLAAISSFLRRILGDSINEDELNFWLFSLLSQCLYYIQNRNLVISFSGRNSFIEDNFDAIASHISSNMITLIEDARFAAEDQGSAAAPGAGRLRAQNKRRGG
ncbi:MAG: hypothetical protein A2X49_06805 [Lentisphaerae bacterium GWF2_52_8]|nr:MAG: hypothetical protein A2X49_06805 [Lentisphaerae bacterium GWF2_52_8]